MNPLLRLFARIAAPIVNTVNRVIQAIAPESQFAQSAQSFTQSVNTAAGVTRGNTPVSFSDTVRGTEPRPAAAPTSTSDRLRDTGTGNYSAPAPAQPTMTAEQRRQAELNRQAEATKKHIGFEDMGSPAPPPRSSAAAAPTSTSDRLRDTGSFEYSRPAAYNQAFLQQPSVEEEVAGFLRFLAIDYDEEITPPLEALAELFDFVATIKTPDGSLPPDLKLMLRTSEAMIPDVAAALDIWGRWGKVKTTSSFKVGFGAGIPGLGGIGQVGMGLGSRFAGLGGWGGDIERVPDDASENDTLVALQSIYLAYMNPANLAINQRDNLNPQSIQSIQNFLPSDLTPSEYATMLSDVFGYQIEFPGGNNFSPAQYNAMLTHLLVSNMQIVDYFDKLNLGQTGLEIFQDYFAENKSTGESITVYLGSQGFNTAVSPVTGYTPLPASSPDVNSLYLGSNVAVVTITHEFFHQFDRSLEQDGLPPLPIRFDTFLLTQQDWAGGTGLLIDNTILTGRANPSGDSAEEFADTGMTAVLSGDQFAIGGATVGWNFGGSQNAALVKDALKEYLEALFKEQN